MDSNTTLTAEKAYIKSNLRIYSNQNTDTVITIASDKKMDGISLKAYHNGKTAKLTVWGSNDGNTWEQLAVDVEITTDAKEPLEYTIGSADSWSYLRLENTADNTLITQIRVDALTIYYTED